MWYDNHIHEANTNEDPFHPEKTKRVRDILPVFVMYTEYVLYFAGTLFRRNRQKLVLRNFRGFNFTDRYVGLVPRCTESNFHGF